MKRYLYKNIHIVGRFPYYKALYMTDNERPFFLAWGDTETKEDVLKRAKKQIDRLNEELRGCRV